LLYFQAYISCTLPHTLVCTFEVYQTIMVEFHASPYMIRAPHILYLIYLLEQYHRTTECGD
jgi:hypothetical protein